MDNSERVLKKADTIRSMIQEENQLINQRITWLITIQGFLFTAFSFSMKNPHPENLIWIFILIGILVSISACLSLRAAAQSIKELMNWWDQYKPSNYSDPDVIGKRKSSNSKIESLLQPWRALPWIFILGWILVFLLKYTRSIIETIDQVWCYIN